MIMGDIHYQKLLSPCLLRFPLKQTNKQVLAQTVPAGKSQPTHKGLSEVYKNLLVIAPSALFSIHLRVWLHSKKKLSEPPIKPFLPKKERRERKGWKMEGKWNENSFRHLVWWGEDSNGIQFLCWPGSLTAASDSWDDFTHHLNQGLATCGPQDVIGWQLPEVFTTNFSGKSFWELQLRNIWRTIACLPWSKPMERHSFPQNQKPQYWN